MYEEDLRYIKNTKKNYNNELNLDIHKSFIIKNSSKSLLIEALSYI